MTTFASNTLALGPDFISADSLAKAGLVVVLLIVFAESGLLVGFFLPGDSLLFTLGLLISQDEVSTPLWLACALIGVAAIAGDQVGYLFGRKAGPALFRRPDSRLFRQEYVEQAHEFFEKHGGRSIVLARFVPIVRTFTPVIAGVSRMNYRTFVVYNVIGGLLWGCGVTVLGSLLGKIDFIRQNLEAMLILIVLISVVPILIEYLRARRTKAKTGDAAGSPDTTNAAGTGPTAGHGPAWVDGPVREHDRAPGAGFAGGHESAGGYQPAGGYQGGYQPVDVYRNADGWQPESRYDDGRYDQPRAGTAGAAGHGGHGYDTEGFQDARPREGEAPIQEERGPAGRRGGGGRHSAPRHR
ncbi:hypothetical protein BBK14_05360 [Parafrankia soli]|uniref:VTT domain-containing protein n=1 Tax=Parafrankia soli TaxID=2599596 RepID=A0A1S1Q143_9ACTN|nr:VTT domain-containing protein [Parafrankia soli]OHV27287.1 hypothetical protein BBK14_05360 [Parafrankia soli]